MKYIDADHLKVEIEKHIKEVKDAAKRFTPNLGFFDAKLSGIYDVMAIIDSLQQEQQMPDSTQLITEWEKEKAVLEQKDFRGDAERMAYNAFLDGFIKGLGYEGTK